jgi:hypothetical protein
MIARGEGSLGSWLLLVLESRAARRLWRHRIGAGRERGLSVQSVHSVTRKSTSCNAVPAGGNIS